MNDFKEKYLKNHSVKEIIESGLFQLFYELFDDEIKKKYETGMMFYYGDFNIRNREFFTVISKLVGEKIAFAVLKGFYLSNFVYDIPEQRNFVDLDLYVDRNQRKKVKKILEDMGYKYNSPLHIDKVDSFRKPYKTGKLPFIIEAHYELFFMDNDELLDKSIVERKEGLECPRFSNEVFFLHLLYHAFFQHFGDIQAKWLVDIMFFLKKKGIDHKRLRKISKKAGLLRILAYSKYKLREFSGERPENIDLRMRIILFLEKFCKNKESCIYKNYIIDLAQLFLLNGISKKIKFVKSKAKLFLKSRLN